jgi:hypothetical protein
MDAGGKAPTVGALGDAGAVAENADDADNYDLIRFFLITLYSSYPSVSFAFRYI